MTPSFLLIPKMKINQEKLRQYLDEALEANTMATGYISVLGTKDTKSNIVCPQNLCKLNWPKKSPLALFSNIIRSTLTQNRVSG